VKGKEHLKNLDVDRRIQLHDSLRDRVEAHCGLISFRINGN